jgi:hypothetical protein
LFVLAIQERWKATAQEKIEWFTEFISFLALIYYCKTCMEMLETVSRKMDESPKLQEFLVL